MNSSAFRKSEYITCIVPGTGHIRIAWSHPDSSVTFSFQFERRGNIVTPNRMDGVGVMGMKL